jgi:CheY-like chemotaxis protein
MRVPEEDVLIVDDDLGVCALLTGALRDAGYAVDVAATVAEARNLLGHCQYRMVVADWRLPDGDGTAVANLAAAIGAHAFVMIGYLARSAVFDSGDGRVLSPPLRSTLRAFAVLSEPAQAALRHDMEDLYARHNQAADGRTSIMAKYVEIVATRA